MSAQKKVNNAVEFLGVPSSYPPSKDLTIGFKCPSGTSVTSSDWVGIFKVGWSSTRDYYTFEWVAWTSPVQEKDEKAGSVTFAGRRIPPSDGNMYQFCYVGKDYSMKGCSRPFVISTAADDFSDIESDFVEITNDDLDQLRSAVVINAKSNKKGGIPAEMLELKEAVAKLTNEKDGQLKDLAAAKQRIAILEEELGEKQKAFEYVQQNYAEIVKEAEERQAKLDKMAAELQEQKESGDAQVSVLSANLTSAQEETTTLRSKILKFEVESSDLRLEIGKLLADVEEGQEKLRTCEGEKADLVTSKLSLENEIKLLKETMVSRDAFEALQQALKHDVTEPATSMAIVSEKEILEARNEELVTKLNMCKDEYTQKCYEIRTLHKQLAAMKVSGEMSGGDNEVTETVMQELESRRERCQELEGQNARFEEMNLSLEERILVAEQIREELQEEKISSDEKYESIIREKDELVTDLTQQLMQLNEELASFQDSNATKIQQMSNAIQSLRVQLEDKDKEITALKAKNTPAPQPTYPQHHAHPRGQLVAPTIPVPVPPTQCRQPPAAAAATNNNTKECPMCQVKFPASFGNSEFEAHVQSHFDY